ncbi:MAG TPA: TVP38/TMEM64 family protein [Anaeromyxobacter sp.]
MSGPARKLAVMMLAAGAAAGFLLLPLDRWLLSVVDSIRGAGALGVGAFSIAYVAATVLLLPGAALTAGAGFAYGPLWGTVLASPVSVVAATLAFLLGRTVARRRIARRIAGNPRFAAIDEAIGEGGLKIVFLLRLSPLVPFNLLNYALGLSRVSLRDYVVASAVGMLPGTVLYVYLGSLVTSASELAAGARPSAGGWERALYWAGLAATLGATWLLTRIARRALSRAIESRPAAPLAPAEEVRP